MTQEDRDVRIQSQRVEPALPIEWYPLTVLRAAAWLLLKMLIPKRGRNASW